MNNCIHNIMSIQGKCNKNIKRTVRVSLGMLGTTVQVLKTKNLLWKCGKAKKKSLQDKRRRKIGNPIKFCPQFVSFRSYVTIRKFMWWGVKLRIRGVNLFISSGKVQTLPDKKYWMSNVHLENVWFIYLYGWKL